MKNKFENRSDTRCGSFLYILYEVFFIPYVNFKFKLATHGDLVARYHQPSNFSNRVGP